MNTYTAPLASFLIGLTIIVASLGPMWISDESATPTSSVPRSSDQSHLPPLADIILFTEDNAISPPDGCDAVSIFDLKSAKPFHLGKQFSSPGRMAFVSDLSLVIANRTNGIYATGPLTAPLHSVYALHRTTGGGDGWEATWLSSVPWTTPVGGTAITPDGQYLLIATQESSDRAKPCVGGQFFGVSKFALSEIDWIGKRLGPERGRLELPVPVAEIIMASSGTVAHLVLVPMTEPSRDDLASSNRVVSIDVQNMERLGRDVVIKPIGRYPIDCVTRGGFRHHPLRVTHATLSTDEKLLITNRWIVGELNVVDLVARIAWQVSTPGITMTGGVAFNKGWVNPELLAVHGVTSIGTYRWREGGELELVARAPVESPVNLRYDPAASAIPSYAGPQASIAWSGDGSHLIAGASIRGPFDFRSWRVSESGARLTEHLAFEACADRGDNFPNDIATFNGLLPSPTVTLVPATTTPTPTITPSQTPTRDPAPIFLPLLLRETCLPEQRRVDAVLVLDASLSMLEVTAPGSSRTKLDAAREAAQAFLSALRLGQGDQAAVVVFNAQATLLSGLTADRAALDAALGSMAAAPQTCIVCGVDSGASELASARHDPDNAPVLILLTDGRSNPQPVSAAVTRASAAKAGGIRIFTIGLGSDLDASALRDIASEPAAYWHAPSAAELAGIYRAIAVDIPCPGAAFWAGR